MNERITAPEVLLIDEAGEKLGVLSRQEALETAGRASLDLVEISPHSKPPVCRIMDYGKFQFHQRKKTVAAKKKQKTFQIKEVKFRPTTDEADYQVKLRRILKFLENGDKVKVTIRFRGRELAHQGLGLDVLKRVVADAKEIGGIEQQVKSEGRQLLLVLAPLKKN